MDRTDHIYAFLAQFLGGATTTGVALLFMSKQMKWVRKSIIEIVAHSNAAHSYNQWTHGAIRAICNGLHIRVPESPKLEPLKVDSPPPEGPDWAAISGSWRKP